MFFYYLYCYFCFVKVKLGIGKKVKNFLVYGSKFWILDMNLKVLFLYYFIKVKFCLIYIKF